MPYTYILDDNMKSLILTADHLTLLFLPGFFYKIKNFFFLLWVNLFMIKDTHLHDPPPFNGPFFMTPPFSAVLKSCDPPSVSTSLLPANFWQVLKPFAIFLYYKLRLWIRGVFSSYLRKRQVPFLCNFTNFKCNDFPRCFSCFTFLECDPEETHGGTYTKLHDSFGMVVNSTIACVAGNLSYGRAACFLSLDLLH